MIWLFGVIRAFQNSNIYMLTQKKLDKQGDNFLFLIFEYHAIPFYIVGNVCKILQRKVDGKHQYTTTIN